MEEKVLMEGLCKPFKNKIAVHTGKGILTNKRFIFCKHSVAKTLAIGVLVNFTKGDFEYDIPMENIKEFKIISKGILGNILNISLKDGSEKNYGILKAIDWEIAFKNALNGYAESQEKKESEPIAQGEKKFCTNCGGVLTGNEKFCGSCGTKIE